MKTEQLDHKEVLRMFEIMIEDDVDPETIYKIATGQSFIEYEPETVEAAQAIIAAAEED
jgi:hypothetical protein